MKEGRTIQQRLPKGKSPKSEATLSRSFSNLMFMGKCKEALELLSRNDSGGVLHLNDLANPKDPNSPTVRDTLISKHPSGQPAQDSCILPEVPEEYHSMIFESLDAKAIRSASLRVRGGAGPSGLDSLAWRRLCTNHKGASGDLSTLPEGSAQHTWIPYHSHLSFPVVSLSQTNSLEYVQVALATLPIASQEGTPLTMPMYSLATIPLIRKLKGTSTQVWYVDDSVAIGKTSQLRAWWDKLAKEGPGFGYFPNPLKTWLVTKEDHLEDSTSQFSGSGVNITTKGRPYLGATLKKQNRNLGLHYQQA